MTPHTPKDASMKEIQEAKVPVFEAPAPAAIQEVRLLGGRSYGRDGTHQPNRKQKTPED